MVETCPKVLRFLPLNHKCLQQDHNFLDVIELFEVGFQLGTLLIFILKDLSFLLISFFGTENDELAFSVLQIDFIKALVALLFNSWQLFVL
jgi:hypothetical protein